MNDVSNLVFDVGEANFTTDVVEASQSVPVLVDFWAEWCAPCRELGPVLERLAVRAAGGFRLGKVDTEKEQRLAGAFQVQSIPFVVAFKGGKPADAFVGVKSEPELVEFLTRLGVEFEPAEDESDQAKEKSAFQKSVAALREADLQAFDEALPALEAIEEDEDGFAGAQRILEALDWIQGRIQGDQPAARQLRAAREVWLEGHWGEAMEELLGAVSTDRDHADQMARRALVLLMQCHDEEKDLMAQTRRRLALLLY